LEHLCLWGQRLSSINLTDFLKNENIFVVMYSPLPTGLNAGLQRKHIHIMKNVYYGIPQPNEWLAVVNSSRPQPERFYIYLILCAHSTFKMLTEKNMNASKKFLPRRKSKSDFLKLDFKITSVESCHIEKFGLYYTMCLKI
jgi:hypothetical protein